MAWSSGAVLTAAQLDTYAPQAWTTWTPTISAQTGTITTASSSNARYIAYGKTIHWNLTITVTTAGTGTDALRFTLPVTARAATMYIGNGRETASTGFQLQVYTGTTTLGHIFKYDNTTIIASGRTIIVSGTYEAA